MSNKNSLITLFSILLLLPLLANAEGLRYDSFSVNYTIVDIESYSEDITGFDLGVSKSINENIFIKAEYLTGSVEIVGFGDLDITGVVFGFGYHTPLNEKSDIVSNFSIIRGEGEFLGVTEDVNGYAISAGIRSELSEKLEGLISLTYSDVEDETDTSLSLGGGYWLNDTSQIILGVDFEDDQTTSFGIRFYYD